MDRWRDRRKDRQALFYRTLPTEAGGPKMFSFSVFTMLINSYCFSDKTVLNKGTRKKKKKKLPRENSPDNP